MTMIYCFLFFLLLLPASVEGFGTHTNPVTTTIATSRESPERRLQTATPWIIDTIPNDSPINPSPPSLWDTAATFVASIVLDAVDTVQGRSLAEKNHVAAAAATTKTATSHHSYLSNDELVTTLLQDITDRNSLVTADFTRTLYQDDCLFNDGSDLDGAYPLKPWILGCKILFCGDHSRTQIIPETLTVSDHEVSFRFESYLEFRGPFRPTISSLTGTIVLTRNYDTGRVCYYQEFWDTSCSEILRQIEFHHHYHGGMMASVPVLERTLRSFWYWVLTVLVD